MASAGSAPPSPFSSRRWRASACWRFALRELPVGTAYAVWTGIGAVGAAIAGMVLLGEAATVGRVVPIALIGVGIVWLALGE